MKTRIVVVDDSALLRRILIDILATQPDFEIVGQGRNGQEAVRLVRELRPDVVTLDVEMPVMDGLDALREIMREFPTPVLMVSSRTVSGAEATLEALHSGAADCLAKPQDRLAVSMHDVREELVTKVRAVRGARVRERVPVVLSSSGGGVATDRVVVLAASTGGPRALNTFFEGLPKGFGAPILMVQHMPAGFVESLAKRLNAVGTVPCRVMEAGDCVEPGVAQIAPSGTHVRVQRDGHFEFVDGPTIHGVRPSADPLFQSAAEVYGARTVGVVLTGMGKDGAEGAKAIRDAGGTVFAEHESSCVIYGMPRAAKVFGAVHHEVPIERMGEAVAQFVAQPVRGRRAS
jgi:two-component system chemotaxis response regulator CheB